MKNLNFLFFEAVHSIRKSMFFHSIRKSMFFHEEVSRFRKRMFTHHIEFQNPMEDKELLLNIDERFMEVRRAVRDDIIGPMVFSASTLSETLHIQHSFLR